MTDFMSAGMVVDDLLAKKEQILCKTANEISEAIITRMKDGKVGNSKATENDISKIIEGFSVEEQNVILLHIITNLAKCTNVSGRSSNEQKNNSYHENRKHDIFASRR